MIAPEITMHGTLCLGSDTLLPSLRLTIPAKRWTVLALLSLSLWGAIEALARRFLTR